MQLFNLNCHYLQINPKTEILTPKSNDTELKKIAFPNSL